MPLDAKKYQELQAVIAASQGKAEGDDDYLPPDVLQRAQDAVAEFDQDFAGRSAQAVEIPEFDPAKLEAIKGKLTGSLAVVPQVLAMQPATGHPEGDEKAEEEWVRGDLSNPAGTVVVYDAPASTVRQKLLEQPELFRALGQDQPLSPEAVMAIKPGDSLVDAYNDMSWRKTADAAVQAGKTPYRYSKAPWMQSGNGAGLLDTLSTKIQAAGNPIGAGVQAFIMGHDETAMFGSGTSQRESGAAQAPLAEAQAKYGRGTAPPPTSVPGATATNQDGDEEVGGIPKGLSPKEEDDVLREEHPALHAAGQVAGIVPGLVSGAAERLGLKGLAQWSPANALWDWVTGEVMTHPSALSQAVPAVIKGVGAGAVAAGAEQGAREATRASANAAAPGDQGTSLTGAAVRTLDATKWGAAGALPGALISRAGKAGGDAIAKGDHFEGIPDQLERLGLKAKLGQGFTDTPEIAAARVEAKGRPLGGDHPLDVLAEKVRNKVGFVADSDGNPYDVYKKTIGIAKQRPGQSDDTAKLVDLAEKHGAMPELESTRALGSLDRLKGIVHSNGRGGKRSLASVPRALDELALRGALPAARAAGQSVALASGKTSRAFEYGEGNKAADKRRNARDQAKVTEYEQKVAAQTAAAEQTNPTKRKRPRMKNRGARQAEE